MRMAPHGAIFFGSSMTLPWDGRPRHSPRQHRPIDTGPQPQDVHRSASSPIRMLGSFLSMPLKMCSATSFGVVFASASNRSLICARRVLSAAPTSARIARDVGSDAGGMHDAQLHGAIGHLPLVAQRFRKAAHCEFCERVSRLFGRRDAVENRGEVARAARSQALLMMLSGGYAAMALCANSAICAEARRHRRGTQSPSPCRRSCRRRSANQPRRDRGARDCSGARQAPAPARCRWQCRSRLLRRHQLSLCLLRLIKARESSKLAIFRTFSDWK